MKKRITKWGPVDCRCPICWVDMEQLPRERGEIVCHMQASHFLYAPIKAGAYVGDAVWMLDGEEIARAPLYAAYEVQARRSERALPRWLRALLIKLKELL